MAWSGCKEKAGKSVDEIRCSGDLTKKVLLGVVLRNADVVCGFKNTLRTRSRTWPGISPS